MALINKAYFFVGSLGLIEIGQISFIIYNMQSVAMVLIFISLSFAFDKCSECNSTVSLIYSLFGSQDTYNYLVKPISFLICNLFYHPKMCNHTLSMLIPTFYYNFFQKEINSIKICQKIGMCFNPYTINSTEKYIQDILKGQPPYNPPTINLSVPTYKFLFFNDIHADDKYQEGRSIHCDEPVCCRTTSKMGQTDSDRAKKYGSMGNCDLPFATLDSFLDKISNPIESVVDAIFWLGDNPGHNVYEQEVSNHLDNIKYITKKLKSRFPRIGQVYPILGNHEGFPSDQFNVHGTDHQWVLDITSDLWRHWLTEESYQTFKAHGRYSQLHPGTKLRIVAINGFDYGCLNSYIWKNNTDPEHQIHWLENTLLNAERNNESVLIIGHIPVSLMIIDINWQDRYHALMERFTNIIRGQIFGHTHSDNIQVMRGISNTTQISGLVYILPQLGIYPSSNPSYRVYDLQIDNYAISNYHQYRLYIEEANIYNLPNWRISYLFNNLYGVDSMNYQSVATALERIKNDSEFASLLVFQQFQEGTRAQEIRDIADAQAELYCISTNTRYSDLINCRKNKAYLANETPYQYLVKYILPKNWYSVD